MHLSLVVGKCREHVNYKVTTLNNVTRSTRSIRTSTSAILIKHLTPVHKLEIDCIPNHPSRLRVTSTSARSTSFWPSSDCFRRLGVERIV